MLTLLFLMMLTRLSYGHVRYGIVPLRAPDIEAIGVMLFYFLTTQSADGILRDSHQMLPVSKSRVMTTAEGGQVIQFILDKKTLLSAHQGRCVHLLQPLMLGGMGVTGTADESSLCSWFECVVWLSLCGSQFGLLVS